MITPKINLVVIRSPDIDRAVTFYEALGLTFTKHSHGSGPEHYACEDAGCVFEVYPLTEKSTSTESTRLGFVVTDVDEAVGRLVENGATVVSDPKDSSWGRRAVVADFDGHRVELTNPSSA